MPRVGHQHRALVQAHDVTVVEGPAAGLEVALRMQLEGVLGPLDVSDLHPLAVVEGTAPARLAQDLLGLHPRRELGAAWPGCPAAPDVRAAPAAGAGTGVSREGS